MWSQSPSEWNANATNKGAADQKVLAEAASAYLSRGWSIIPLIGKQPALAWKEFQSRPASPHDVEYWFIIGERLATGVGIVTGNLSGLVVVDCDSATDAAFWEEHYPGSPLIAETGGGGTHFYYAMPDGVEVRNRAGVLARKIDIRGEGGYAAAPPSQHPNGPAYAWRASNWAATLPSYDAKWIVDDARPARLPTCQETTIIRNAVAYISRIHAVAGEGGHNATFRAACKLRDAGLSQEEALAVLSDWNETNASPTWSAVELRHKIVSAFNLPTR